MSFRSSLPLLLAAGLLGGCATTAERAPALPPLPQAAYPSHDYAGGAIYSPATSMSLFEDQRARRVGDLLTVVLSERTDASKSATTSTARETGFSLGAGSLLGRDFDPANLDTSKDFEGSGSSVQNNRLTGSVTVTVVEVLPNGLLVVEGEKWITINQGREYLRIRGQVRSADVGSDNSVLSTRIGNAQLAYSGSGALASANREGWLTRLFGSVLSPL